MPMHEAEATTTVLATQCPRCKKKIPSGSLAFWVAGYGVFCSEDCLPGGTRTSLSNEPMESMSADAFAVRRGALMAELKRVLRRADEIRRELNQLDQAN
jgi:hypothetical protein